MDYLCQGRSPELRSYAVQDLYDEMISVIANMLNNEKVNTIDIDQIEDNLINNKYKKLWLSKGYITLREDGSW